MTREEIVEMRMAAAASVGLFPRVEIDPAHLLELCNLALTTGPAQRRSAQAESCPAPKLNDDERQCDYCGRVYHESEVANDICLDCRGYNADGTEKAEPGKPVSTVCRHYYGEAGGHCFSADDVIDGRCRAHRTTRT